LHKGEWHGKRVLDEKEVSFISAYFEEYEDIGEPLTIIENADHIYQGSIYLGDGFLLTHEEASELIKADLRNQEVIFPVINGQEVNNAPQQDPGRSIINFFNWEIGKAGQYKLPFQIVEKLVKPERMKQKDKGGQDYWWRFLRPRNEMYSSIHSLRRCFVITRVTKYLNFSSFPTNYVFLNTTYVFTTDRWDLYSVVQSAIHEVWARKYSMSLKQDLQYSPSDCFETFPFPAGLWQTANPALAAIGERYHEERRALMRQLWLGLTDLYNLFHQPALTPALVAKTSKQPDAIAAAGYQGILALRTRHHELDHAVLAAYGWGDLALGHDFHAIDTLPENDRIRYTISPSARKELLRRLLALNHERAATEAAAVAVEKGKKKGGKGKKKEAVPQLGLFEA
jgi:hypothetical protein